MMMMMMMIAITIATTFSFMANPCLCAYQNVTTLLRNHPGTCKSFNTLLSTYGVASAINSRTTITVLCPPNAATDAFFSSRLAAADRQTIFNILSFHVLLDYEDPEKLRSLSDGSAIITTLFQTTGLSAGLNGFLNLTTLTNGTTLLRSASAPAGSPPLASVLGSLESFPFNISILSISAVLNPTGASLPPPSPVNATDVLARSDAGNFSTFVSLLVSSGVDKVFQSHDSSPGLTIFAPTNSAFDRMSGSKAYASLSMAQIVSLLEFHGIASFFPNQELLGSAGSQPTLATTSVNADYKLSLTRSTKTGVVSIITNGNANPVPIMGTLYSNNPASIFSIDSLLLPAEIFPSTAVSPSPSITLAPGPNGLGLSPPDSSPAISQVMSPASASAPGMQTPTKSSRPTASSSPPSYSPPAPPADLSFAGPQAASGPNSSDESSAQSVQGNHGYRHLCASIFLVFFIGSLLY